MPISFLHACFLLLLKEEPVYGYDLETRDHGQARRELPRRSRQ